MISGPEIYYAALSIIKQNFICAELVTWSLINLIKNMWLTCLQSHLKTPLPTPWMLYGKYQNLTEITFCLQGPRLAHDQWKLMICSTSSSQRSPLRFCCYSNQDCLFHKISSSFYLFNQAFLVDVKSWRAGDTHMVSRRYTYGEPEIHIW
jgi:hypothetical protein